MSLFTCSLHGLHHGPFCPQCAVSDLTRAKAVFQLRAVEAVIRGEIPASSHAAGRPVGAED